VAHIGVLGPLEVHADDGAVVALRSMRQRVLLAVLASRCGRVVPTDDLVDALWPDRLPANPGASLQSQLHRLRRQLDGTGATISTDEVGYRLEGPAEQVDAARFERLVADADAPGLGPARALASLDEALALWRGRPYSVGAVPTALEAEASRLEELRASALEGRCELLLAAGRPAEAAAVADQLAREQPYRERPVACRMRALARQGRHAEALRAYDDFRRRLGDDIGAEPSPELRSLEEEILRHETPPTPAVGVPGDSFLGRESELVAVAQLLDGSRLVTLTGPGGVGKTRLALHAAERQAGGFPDGVHLCELATVPDPAAVAAAVVTSLGIESRGTDLAQRVVRFLQAKRALLVLDNCEHVSAAVGELVRLVLLRAPDVGVLATSRQRLGIEGEHVVVVGPLPTGDEGAVTDEGQAVDDGPGEPDVDREPALVLLLDRAAAFAGRAPGPDERPAARELCRRLDGLPLAIELAAAGCATHSVDELLDEVGDHLDRLADTRRAVGRHRSIDALMDWSYGLLGDGAKAVFRRISVFRGGFTAPAAAALLGWSTAESAAALVELADHSLTGASVVAGRARFSVLEPVRQYAHARLSEAGEEADARRAHAAWAVDWLEEADAALRGPDEARWVAAVGAELANLRAAHRWCLRHDAARSLRLVAALFWYGYWYGTAELFTWADEAVARCSGPPRALAGASATAAIGAWRHGDLARARAIAERAVALVDADDTAARFAWEAMRSTEGLAGDHERAIACGERARALARAAGDPVHEAHDHVAGALALGYLRRPAEAERELRAASAILDRADNPTERAFVDYVTGEMLVETAPAEALPHLERARAAATSVGNRFVAGIAGASAASCAARVGPPGQALGQFCEVISHFHRADAWTQLWTAVRALVQALAGAGRSEEAAVLLGAMAASASAPVVRGPDLGRMEATVAGLAADLGAARLAELQAEGAALGDERAVAMACATALAPTPARRAGPPDTG
jgi:predicted ATPase/DNA-binding SARP family transcriptional activator